MKVIGYTYNGSAYCPACASLVLELELGEEWEDAWEVNPIFAIDEWDYQPSCDFCLGIIETSVVYFEDPSA